MNAHIHAADIPLEVQIAECTDLCGQRLALDYAGFGRCPSKFPQTPPACFELLYSVPENPASTETFRRFEQAAKAMGFSTPYSVERFVVLQACLAALRRLPLLPVDDSVKAQFCMLCRHLASARLPADRRFAMGGGAFIELAKLITLRRFHAGQLSFDIMDMPRAWLLKVHPIELPGLARELLAGFGGLGPVVMPHINYWRTNPLFVTLKEHEKSLQRIAKCLEADPALKGFISSSWVYADAVGEVTPHLAWLRDFFAENNGYVVDCGPALEDAGFLVGSDRRKQLHSEGRFHIRETLILWRRDDLLGWAKRKPAEDASRLQAPHEKPTGPRPRARGQPERRPAVRSGDLTLMDCRRWLYYKPRSYIPVVLGAPLLVAGVVAAALMPVAAVFPVVAAVLAAMYFIQYFLLQ